MKQLKITVGNSVRYSGFYTMFYCGMNNSDTFSISWASSANFYYKIGMKKISFYNKEFNVIKVTEEELILEQV